MYKLLFIFIIFISSPIYSNEFTYRCDNDDIKFSIIYKVDRKEKTVVHTHSINKNNFSMVYDINKVMDIYHWDEENDSVWFINYDDSMISSPSLTLVLLNFELQKLHNQSLLNVTPRSGEYRKERIFQNNTFDCYTLE